MPGIGDEVDLVNRYGIDGADAEELLGFGDDDDEEDLEDGDRQDDGDDELGGADDDDDDDDSNEFGPAAGGLNSRRFLDFKTTVRLEAVKRHEGNRRRGGLDTQNACVRDWNVSLSILMTSDEY